ncbi:MAG: hypothetical protein KH452_06495 [Clostridiales bacterium]|nr:hypothetical protein [Clostridiales bacterium]
MKYAVKLYRLFKPVYIYTSYLFTSLTILCLAANELSGRNFPVTAGLLWGLFAFSLGSIGLQKLFLELKFKGRPPYPVCLILYICSAALWGFVCLNLFYGTNGNRTAEAALIPVILPGVFCCAALEIFNRYRAHMYNTLLAQYKRRKRS